MLLVYASVCFRYFSLIPIFLLINLHLSIYYPNIAEQKKQNMIPIDEKHIIKKLKAGDNEAYNIYMIIIMLLSVNLVIIY